MHMNTISFLGINCDVHTNASKDDENNHEISMLNSWGIPIPGIYINVSLYKCSVLVVIPGEYNILIRA